MGSKLNGPPAGWRHRETRNARECLDLVAKPGVVVWDELAKLRLAPEVGRARRLCPKGWCPQIFPCGIF